MRNRACFWGMVTHRAGRWLATGLVLGAAATGLMTGRQPTADALSTPWNAEGMAQGSVFQSLAIGRSAPNEVHLAMGQPPDEIVKTAQMFPVVENHVYYDEKGSGGATIWIFEQNKLVGIIYRSPGGQVMDLTYLLPDAGDRVWQLPSLAGYQGWYPNFPLYSPVDGLW